MWKKIKQKVRKVIIIFGSLTIPWGGSSWYYPRMLSPKYPISSFDKMSILCLVWFCPMHNSCPPWLTFVLLGTIFLGMLSCFLLQFCSLHNQHLLCSRQFCLLVLLFLVRLKHTTSREYDLIPINSLLPTIYNNIIWYCVC